MPWTSTYQGSNNRFFPSSSLIPSSSYFQCLMQTVSHFSSIFFFLCHVEHFAVSKLQTLILFLFSRKKNESQHFTLTVREMMSYSGRFFIAGGLYAFIARARHVVQPEGQELTFSKCLRRLPSLCGFYKGQAERGGSGRGENLFSLHLSSQAIIENAFFS